MASNSGDPSGSTTTTIVSVRFCHVFNINGYTSTLNTHNDRPSFDSGRFAAGGRTWHVSYRSMGSPHHPENTDSISLYLALDDIVDEAVNAQATFSLLDQEGRPVPRYSRTTRMNNFSASMDRSCGCERFIAREALELSEYLQDDCFAVGVNIHVVKQAPIKPAVPDSDMHQHFGDLLSTGDGADVRFRVGEKTFSAHRLVLAARSPVFRAELYGPMREGTATTDAIEIEDMEAQVFGALLHFVYTDTWPEMEQEDESAMGQHLLVAADRYGLERLKLMCEDTLLRCRIGADSVVNLLALADKHGCPRLEEACFEFLRSSRPLFAIIEAEHFEAMFGLKSMVATPRLSQSQNCENSDDIVDETLNAQATFSLLHVG